MTARTFTLIRTEDISGVSGTGIVAEGVEFTDLTVALRWRSDPHPSTVLHDSIAAVEAIHGHGGRTKVAWAVAA